MTERTLISETSLQSLKGDFPDVPTYSHVDTALLYQGDESPFHVTLPIAEIGRVSDNGLEYDSELVNAIAEQMSNGAGGIRGHIPDDQLSTAYPVDDVHWIGHQMQGNTLWAKGYIPVGPTREDIRMKKARGGNIATSIFGDAVKEFQTGAKKTWKARQFALEQIDLAPTKRAALKNKHGFAITREMEGDIMPSDIVTVTDVPEPIREQIIRESDLAKRIEKVAEIEQENTSLRAQVAELATFKHVCAEISTTIGNNVDIVPVVTMYHDMATKLAEMMGVPFASIEIKVREMHEQLESLQAAAFDSAVDTQVEELTKWDAKTDSGKAQVTSFRNILKKAVVSEMGKERAVEKIAETAKKLWDEQYSVIGGAVVASLAGPGAFVPPKASTTPTTSRISDEQLAAAGKTVNASRN